MRIRHDARSAPGQGGIVDVAAQAFRGSHFDLGRILGVTARTGDTSLFVPMNPEYLILSREIGGRGDDEQGRNQNEARG
jgi:hypothetical protein